MHDWQKPARKRDGRPDFSGIPIEGLRPPRGFRLRYKTQRLKPRKLTSLGRPADPMHNTSHGAEISYGEWCRLEAIRLTAASGYQHKPYYEKVEILNDKKEVIRTEQHVCILDTGVPVPVPTLDIWTALAEHLQWVFGDSRPLRDTETGKLTVAGRARVNATRIAILNFILWRPFSGTREILSER